MKKIFLSSAIASVLVIGLTGCTGEDISCNEETTQALVKQITEPSVINSIFLSKYQNGDYGEADFMTMSLLNGSGGNLKALGELYGFNKIKTDKNGKKPKMAVLYDNYIEFEKNFKNPTVSLDSFMTTAKDKELSKVECSATLNVVYENNTYSFDTSYTAQLTDDKKQVSVQVDTFSKK